MLPDGAVKVMKMMKHRPQSWTDCVHIARIKFEKYFNHKVISHYSYHSVTSLSLCSTAMQAKNLLHAFPMDTKMPDGCKLHNVT